jgi:MFS family permease
MGFGTSTTLALQAGNSVLALVAEVLCIAYVDRLGRRQPLIWSFAASGACFVVIAALAGAYGTTNAAASRAFVAVTWLYNFVFSLAVGPLAWAVPVEMFGSRHRGKATAVTSSAQWIFNFMIAQVTPIALAKIGWRYWVVFAVCGTGSAVWTWVSPVPI